MCSSQVFRLVFKLYDTCRYVDLNGLMLHTLSHRWTALKFGTVNGSTGMHLRYSSQHKETLEKCSLFVITWLSACLDVKVTIGVCPCRSFFGSLSIHWRALISEPTVMTQKPFDCPLARFSWNRTSTRSCTPIALIAFSTSASVVHCIGQQPQNCRRYLFVVCRFFVCLKNKRKKDNIKKQSMKIVFCRLHPYHNCIGQIKDIVIGHLYTAAQFVVSVSVCSFFFL